MPGTVFNSTSLGVHLYSAVTQNPATIATGAIITNVTAGYAGNAIYADTYSFNVHNFGTVSATQSGATGINLHAGGSVFNGNGSYTATRISGDAYGIFVYGGPGTIVNSGTIEGTRTYGFSAGVLMHGGGQVVNGASGATSALISGFHAVDLRTNPGSVTNYGTIAGVGQYSYGVRIRNGGDFTNAASGFVTGYYAAVIRGGGTLTNLGTIIGTGGGGYVEGGGEVINGALGTPDALISGYYGVYSPDGIDVTNYGTIAGSATGSYFSSGVFINDDGSVINGAATQTALITGYDGVRIAGVGTVTNYGTISGLAGYGVGVSLYGGGVVTNQSSGLITAEYGISVGVGAGTITNYGTIFGEEVAVSLVGAAGTINNFGTLAAQYGSGAELLAGGTVINQVGGLIVGYDGVRIYGPSAVLTNYGTIASNGTGFGAQGVDFLSGGTLSNQGTIVGSNTYASGVNAGFANDLIINGGPFNGNAIIAGWLNGIDQFSGTGTVVNYGTISSSNGDAVYLQAGGTVSNQTGGLITGYRFGINSGNGSAAVYNIGVIAGQSGIVISGGTGAVDNSGTIVATRGGGYSSLGVALRDGGSVGNTGLIQATGALGVYIGGAAGSVTNSGTIVSYYSGSYGYFGAYLRAGGNLTNQAAGVIFGVAGGVAIAGGGTVTNYGTISGYQAVTITGAGVVANYGVMAGAAAGTNAVYLYGGGTVTNSGVITGGNDVVKVRIGGLVSNSGTVAAAGGTGIWLPDGGTVVNNGLVTGTDDVIFTGYTTGTVINYGTIIDTGAYGDGVCLDAGGTVFNAGLITGPTNGIEIDNGLGLVVNTGTIGGGGIYLGAGGSVANAATALIQGSIQGVAIEYGTGSVLNYGTIAGTGTNSGGIYLTAGGTITNASTGIITGTTDGIIIGNATGTPGATGAVLNYGTIVATNTYSTGVWLIAGGNVSNAAYGYIQGFDGVVTGSYLGTGVGTVVNDGSIAGGNVGVWLAAGGTVVNSAAITATSGHGVVIGSYGGLGAVLNYGAIVAPLISVFLEAGGSVGNYGTIASTSSNGFALDVEGGAGTVLNAGTISGYGIGILLEQGGSVTNLGAILNPGTYGHGIRISNYGGTGFVHNYGLISGPTTGIYASAPTSLINLGTVAGTGAYGSGDGVRLTGYPGTVFNVGTILGTGRGVYLGAGGSVSNQPGGSIIGGSGVGIVSGTGSVANLGTIAATGVTGIGVFLGLGGSVTNGAIATPSALISGASRGVVVYGAPGAVANYGTITASIGYAPAVYLVAGGTVNNKSSGVIQGGGLGVLIVGGTGTVTNAGAITGTSSAGVRLDAGGTITNGLTAAASITGADGVALLNGGVVFNGSGSSTAAVIDGSTYGIFANYGAATVANYGTITGTAGAGILLAGSGFVANASGAVIASGNIGVEILNAAGALSNAGTVQGGNLGVYLAAGGSVFNGLAGTIAGADGVRVIYGAGTVTNCGAISATGTSGFAVQLSLGGNVVNGAATATGASIVGTLRGVSVYTAGGYVNNFGTIAATITYAVGVYLHAGGGLTNQLGGLIRGGGDGVIMFGGPGTVTNLGSIDGLTDTGVVMASGGLLVNGPGGVTSATISGGFAGVQLQGQPATIVNYGTIVDPGFAGVVAVAGATISNSGLVTGYQYGVTLNGGVGIVTNSGEISATGTGGTGIILLAGGALLGPNAIANYGTIAGGSNGVFFVYDTNITNYGLIAGTSLAGVYGFSGVGVVTNLGTIDGGAIGVQLAGGTTLFNAGTIAGGSLSVYFTGSYSRVAVDPSAVFIGNIDAQLGGGDVIELAPGTGVFSGFDTSFVGFEQIAVDPGADWQISGPVTFGAGFIVTDAGALDFDNDLNNDGTLNIETGAVLSFTGTVGGSGVIDFNGAYGTLVIGVPSTMTNSIVDFAPTDRIAFVGIGVAASYSYSGGVLRLNNSGGTQIAQVSLTTPVTNPHFILSDAGGGGSTMVGINAPTGTFTGAYFNGVVLNDPTVQNPALVTSTAFITNNYGSHSGDAVYGTSAASWNLTNYGTITTNPTATSAAGVRFQAGGTVSNAAIISGGINGIVIDGGVGLVGNGGVIVATDTGTGAGIALHGGGNVFNSTGATVAGFNNGVFIGGGIGAVVNDGTIQSSATAGGAAVYLGLGGAVTNLAGGLITAYRSAVSIKGGFGLISNYGTIAHSSTLSPATYLGAGGIVINGAGGLILSPHRNAVVISGAAGAVTNSGTILSTATFAQAGTIQTGRYSAVVLTAGGVVSNAPNALIAGHTGIDFNNLAGTVVNAGTISQNDPIRYGAGVLMYGGGLVRNGPNSAALITAYNTGVQVSASSQGLGAGGPGTVVNYGTIAHIGAGTSGLAIYLGGGGIVVNYGLISGARAGYSGSYPGAVSIRNQTGVVINFGTIANPNNSNGVNLLQGGILINGAGGYNAALIDAPHTAVYIGGTLGTTGTVINYGTIRNTTSLANAVTIAAGGTAINYGLISSARTGISFTNTAGTIDNSGTIVSTAPLSGTRGAGVYLGAGGMITNEAGGLITAYRAAVSLAFFGTTTADAVITNYGVLSGATGISIGVGDTGDNTIVNFGTITGTNGIAILLGSGDDEIVLASSSQLNGAVGNFQAGDTFDLPFLIFSSAETVSLDAGNVLRINQSGTLVYSIQLDPSQSFGTDEFGLANDGTGGTLVVLGPDTTPPVTEQRVLAVNANSGPTPIGILAPADPDDPPAVLTVTVNGLPSDGTVVLADGVTPVSTGQILTVDQLTSLAFIPTPNINGQSSTFTYSVSDPTGNTGLGTAFLGINLPPPPNSPSLINGLGGAEGFGENALPADDDNSSSAIDITAVFGSGLNFFGSVFTSLFVNNNGNITFTGPLSAFTPESINAGFGNPIIAAFWADVDTTGGPGVPTGGNATGSNTVYWDLDTVNHVFTATWDDVGYFNSHNDKLDAFQLRLIDQGGGNFDIEFRYQAIYWTTGDLDDPATEAARAGFSAGDGVNFYELPQSGHENDMLGLPSNPAPDGTQGTTAETGVYRFEVRNGVVVPPVLTGLVLSPASDSGKPGDNRTNDTTPTITGAGGVSGDTVTLLANGTVAGTGTVAADGTWQVTAGVLPDGVYSLTATQTDPGGASSAGSATLFVTIDSSAPVTVPVSLTVQPNTGPTVIGIALPADPDDNFSDPNQAPAIVVTTLPTNGTVTLGGVTPVSLGQELTTSQLTGLDFAPAAGQIGTTSSFNYTVTDLAGNTGTGTATFSIATLPPPPSSVQLFDFLFTYNDGLDYYIGTVADSGNLQVGQVIPTVAGHYQIFAVEPTLTTQPSGTVSVSIYSHGGVGQASPTPILTGQGLPDGFGGLTTETDSILGLDGDLHPFSGAVEASFVTIPLWSFIYTYADGRAFYTGTVASQTPVNSQNITDSAGNLIGSYSVFQQGVTTRSNGTVVVDRFNVGGASFTPLRTGLSSVNGQVGLGSEQGLITVNGATFAFSNQLEPPVTITQATLPSTTPPSPNDVFTAEVNQLYREILGRDADPGGLATFTAALANGTSITTLRTQLAQSSEAQTALNQLYHQIFGRDLDPVGASIYTDALINGLSLASVQLILAQSPEGQAAIQKIYQEVLNRPADGGGLTTYMAAIGNPTTPMSLSEVRSVVAHGGELATGLSQLVASTLGRNTFAAELVGMEDEISTDGVTRQTLQAQLISTQTAGTYTRVNDDLGSSLLAAQAGVPTLFLFDDVTNLASETIVGFDPTRDTIALASTVAADFQTVQSHMSVSQTGGTLIHFNFSQEIAIDKVAPGSLGALNFRFA